MAGVGDVAEAMEIKVPHVVAGVPVVAPQVQAQVQAQVQVQNEDPAPPAVAAAPVAPLDRRARIRERGARAAAALPPPVAPPAVVPKFGDPSTLSADEIVLFRNDLAGYRKRHGYTPEWLIVEFKLNERLAVLNIKEKSPEWDESDPRFERLVAAKTLWRSAHENDLRKAALELMRVAARADILERIMRRAFVRPPPPPPDPAHDTTVALWVRRYCGIWRDANPGVRYESLVLDEPSGDQPERIDICSIYTSDVDEVCPECHEKVSGNSLRMYHEAMVRTESDAHKEMCKELAVLIGERSDAWCDGNPLFMPQLLYGPPRYGKSKLMVCVADVMLVGGLSVTYGGSPYKHVPVRDMAKKFVLYGIVGGRCPVATCPWASCDVGDAFDSPESSWDKPQRECTLLLYSQDVTHDMQTWHEFVDRTRFELSTADHNLHRKRFFVNFHDEAHVLSRFGAERKNEEIEKIEKRIDELTLKESTLKNELARVHARPDSERSIRSTLGAVKNDLEVESDKNQRATSLHHKLLQGAQACLRKSFASSFGMNILVTGTFQALLQERQVWGTTDMCGPPKPRVDTEANVHRINALYEAIDKDADGLQQVQPLAPLIPASEELLIGIHRTTAVSYNDPTGFTPEAVLTRLLQIAKHYLCTHMPGIAEQVRDGVAKQLRQTNDEIETQTDRVEKLKRDKDEAIRAHALAVLDGNDGLEEDAKAEQAESDLLTAEGRFKRLEDTKADLEVKLGKANTLKEAVDARAVDARADRFAFTTCEKELLEAAVPPTFPVLCDGMLSYFGGRTVKLRARGVVRCELDSHSIRKLANSAMAQIYLETQLIGSEADKVRLLDSIDDPNAPDAVDERLYPMTLFLPTRNVTLSGADFHADGSMLHWAAHAANHAVAKNQSLIIALWASSSPTASGSGEKGVNEASLKAAFGREDVCSLDDYEPAPGKPVHIIVVKRRADRETGKLLPIQSPVEDQEGVANALTTHFEPSQRDKVAQLTMGYGIFNASATVSLDTTLQLVEDGPPVRVKLLPLDVIAAFTPTLSIDQIFQMVARGHNSVLGHYRDLFVSVLGPKHLVGDIRCLAESEDTFVRAMLHPFTHPDKRGDGVDEETCYRNTLDDAICASRQKQLDYIKNNADGVDGADDASQPKAQRFPTRPDFMQKCRLGKKNSTIDDCIKVDLMPDRQVPLGMAPHVAKRVADELPEQAKPKKYRAAPVAPGVAPPQPQRPQVNGANKALVAKLVEKALELIRTQHGNNQNLRDNISSLNNYNNILLTDYPLKRGMDRNDMHKSIDEAAVRVVPGNKGTNKLLTAFTTSLWVVFDHLWRDVSEDEREPYMWANIAKGRPIWEREAARKANNAIDNWDASEKGSSSDDDSSSDEGDRGAPSEQARMESQDLVMPPAGQKRSRAPDEDLAFCVEGAKTRVFAPSALRR